MDPTEADRTWSSTDLEQLGHKIVGLVAGMDPTGAAQTWSSSGLKAARTYSSFVSQQLWISLEQSDLKQFRLKAAQS